MAYVTQDQILARLPLPELTDALDDDGSGQFNTDLLTGILAAASLEVDGLVGSRYVVPLNPAPAAAQQAALAFALDAIYARRRVPDDKNPFRKDAAAWREHLRAVGRGEKQLDAATALPIQANSGGQPYVPGRVPVAGSPSTY